MKVVKNTHLSKEDMKTLIKTIKDEFPFYKKLSSNSIEYINKDDNKAALKYAHTITLFPTGFGVGNHKLSKWIFRAILHHCSEAKYTIIPGHTTPLISVLDINDSEAKYTAFRIIKVCKG